LNNGFLEESLLLPYFFGLPASPEGISVMPACSYVWVGAE